MLKRILYVLAVIFSSLIANGQNTLPSCVITTPHSNAYFEQGTDVVIRVYATDLGGTYTGGNVTKVEFFNDTTKLGETNTEESNAYTFVWEKIPAGTYRITAKATDNDNAVFTSAGVIITVGSAVVKPIGLSANKGKYLANIVPDNVRSDFNNYWNGVSAENSCKWGSVERTRDYMNWTTADKAYNHAKNNNLPFHYHALAWGSQYPSWIKTLSPADFQAEMEEYMAAIAERYPLIDKIDVLNENMSINSYNKQEHAAGTPYFRAGMGGPGETGYDWAIWLFEKARFYFPNTKLVINDFELVTNSAGRNEILNLIKILRDKGLIDGFGTQSHHFNVDGISPYNLQNALNAMAKSGLPIYVTELDLKGNPVSEANQLNSYKNSFPVYWNHPAVAGITLWGYVEGATWSEGTGLLNSSGTERSAMTWLKSYMESLPNLGYPFSNVGEPLLKYKIEAEDYTEQSGISVIASSEGGDAITGISDDDHCCYGNIDFGLGYANMDLRISSTYSLGKPQGAIEIRIDSINGDLIGTVELVGTGGLDKWETFSGPITGITGVHTIFFVFKTSRINVNWFELKNGITGIRTQKFEPELKIYPNPVTSGKVTVESKTSEKINTIQVIDLQGRIVKTIEPNQYKTEIELSSLIKGMYYLRIQTEYSLLSKKIVIL